MENGFVKSATFQDGTTVYFYDGSFSQADTAITTFGSTLKSEAWWGDYTTANGYAAELKEFIESYNDLSNTLNTPFDPPTGTYGSNAADGFAYNPQYSFAYSEGVSWVDYASAKYQGISTGGVPELGTGHWQILDEGSNGLTATNQSHDGWYHNMLFATATDFSADPNAVPEPSTAIAMGLLGIVGFAGNRRRRRQESVA
ncbi:PEP-CTERM sorting domain-containing protein [Rubripirellula sp.]|nr:PEP-CTERM sorting domain-containing protein [Rubripirellula sp.]